MIILTLIGVATASFNSFMLDGKRTSDIHEFINPFDIDLFDYDAEGEKPEPGANKEPSHKQQGGPDQRQAEINQEVIEV